MKSNLGKILRVALLLGGFAAVSWYLNFDQQALQNESTRRSENADKTREQLVSQTDQVELNITESRKDSDSRPQGDIEGSVGKLDREMAALRDRLNALSASVAANSAESQADNENQEAAVSEEEREAEVKAQIEQQLELYDNVAAQEGVDQEWASNAEADVYESFQNLSDERVGVSEVRCHSSFCQAQISIDNEDTNAAMRKLQEVAPWEGESFIWIEDVEQGEGLIYLAREGQKLPDDNGEL